jgi:ubiquinone/menaquinone biosynthesis C-methylase UbiE
VQNIRQQPTSISILDLGSGRQSFERQLLTTLSQGREPYAKPQIVTVDIARLRRYQLLATKSGTIHSTAAGESLPFPDHHFNTVISNHAIDFMPRGAFAEAFRVLKVGGTAIFYLHHPTMLSGNTNEDPLEARRLFWTKLKNERLLFESADQITSFLERLGFKCLEANVNHDMHDKWWEVVVTKTE